MDNKLSHHPDELAWCDSASVSLSTHVALSQQAQHQQQPSPPTQSSATLPMKETATPDDAPMILERTSSEMEQETNNNLKIFKNEYVNHSSTMKNSNGLSDEKQLQSTYANVNEDSSCNNCIETDESGYHEINVVTDQAKFSPKADLSHQAQIELSSTKTPTAIETASTMAPNPAISTTTTSTTTNATTATDSQQGQSQQVPYIPSANNRSILILREIEPNSLESSVRDIFDSENCPSKPVHCEYALQNSWYVKFKNDEDARLALAYIRKHIVKWNGQQIMARYKPKPAVPSAANQPPMNHQHHIMPPMVIQQQQRPLIEDSESAVDLIDSSSMLGAPGTVVGGVVSTNVPSVSGHNSPIKLNSTAMLSHTGGIAPSNDSQDVTLNNPSGLMPQYGHSHPYHAPSLPPHHHHPDGTLLHHPHHHLTGGHMISQSPQVIQHQNHHHHPMSSGYDPYYGQQGQIMQAPWDLSTVFVYNGLSPFNKTSVSSVSLVSGVYHNQHHHHQRLQQSPAPVPQAVHTHYGRHSPHHQRNTSNNNNSLNGQQMFNHHATKSSRKNNKQHNK